LNLLPRDDGHTLLTPDEEEELIPSLTTRGDLNEWERLNILEAARWALSPRRLSRVDPVTEHYIRELHRRMFDETWKWAGRYRSTEENIGIASYRIRDALGGLIGYVRYWLDYKTFSPDEIAVRLHHRLAFIHPFSIGNGRHARLMADVVARHEGQAIFTWGSGGIVSAGDIRRRYIDALHAADENDLQPLIAFARS
jgi:Fic-DOC domain mobile mystery protein B